MTRPIKPHEVLRRVKMLVKDPPTKQPEQSIERGDVVIDPVRYTVTRPGTLVQVTFLEFRLLYFMASRPNEIRTRDRLLWAIWKEVNVKWVPSILVSAVYARNWR